MPKGLSKENSLQSTNPLLASEWDSDKNSLTPTQVSPNTHKKAWWKCSKGHSWQALISSRNNGRGCPYCSGKKAGYGNDLESNFPALMKEWDFQKNKINPSNITPGSSKKAWWKCSKGHSWEVAIYYRTKGSNCIYCSGKKAGYGNDLESNFPALMKEWDFSKNFILPSEITKYSNKKAWWKCSKGHSWESAVSSRTYSKSNCPYCFGRLATEENNLKKIFPDLIKEWDFQKNSKNPEEYTPSSNKEVFWICGKCKEIFKSTINRRTSQKSGCPYCANQKVRTSNSTISPNNSLKDLFPEIAEEWDIDRNASKADEVFSNSHKFAYWVCKSAGHSWRARIDSRQLNGCPYCKLTPRSRDELYLLFELKTFFNIKEGDNKIKLNKLVDVDIKLTEQKVVIEYDGAYWHNDKAIKDKRKTENLTKAGWTVIRVREFPLDLLDKKNNVQSKAGEYKLTSNVVLKKLRQLGYSVDNLDHYLKMDNLINKIEADKYIQKLLKEKEKI